MSIRSNGQSTATPSSQPNPQTTMQLGGSSRTYGSSLLDILQGSIYGPSFNSARPAEQEQPISQGPSMSLPISQTVGASRDPLSGPSALPVQPPEPLQASLPIQSLNVSQANPDSIFPPALQHSHQLHQAQDQAVQMQEPAIPGSMQSLASHDVAAAEKRATELQYQTLYYKLRKSLLGRVDEFQSALMSKGSEMLPPEYWSVPPQVLVMTVSSYGKVFSHMSEGLKQSTELKNLIQDLSSCLHKAQVSAIHASRENADRGKVALPKPVQFGRLRKKSEFSRMQALFGYYFRNTLLPKALSALENKITEMLKAGFPGVRSEAVSKAEEDGFLLHRTSECTQGCAQCQEFRSVIDWPAGMPLLKNPAAYQKKLLQELCTHYHLSLDKAPAEQSMQAEENEDRMDPDNVDSTSLARNGHVQADGDQQELPGMSEAHETQASVPQLQSPRAKSYPIGGRQKQKRSENNHRPAEHSEALAALLQVTAEQEDFHPSDSDNTPGFHLPNTMSSEEAHQERLDNNHGMTHDDASLLGPGSLAPQSRSLESRKQVEISRMQPYATDPPGASSLQPRLTGKPEVQLPRQFEEGPVNNARGQMLACNPQPSEQLAQNTNEGSWQGTGNPEWAVPNTSNIPEMDSSDARSPKRSRQS